MVTYREFKTMQDSARCLIQIVFEYEKQFISEFITPVRHSPASGYELERVHISGTNMRVTLKFEDYSTVDVYQNLTEVIEWYYTLGEKVINKGV